MKGRLGIDTKYYPYIQAVAVFILALFITQTFFSSVAAGIITLAITKGVEKNRVSTENEKIGFKKE